MDVAVLRKNSRSRKPIAANSAAISASKKAATAGAAYKPGSLLSRRGGMVPTVQLGRRASKKAK
jgi:hypothetical protein